MSKFALIIGNSDYQDPNLRQLIAPAQDVESLARVLSDKNIGGFETVTLLNQPTYKVNQEIESFFADRRRDDLLLLYFSGHGVKDEDGKLYFANADTKLRLLRTTATPANLINEVMLESRSRKQVLILDCCYSGAFAHGMTPRADDKVLTRENFEGRGRVVLTASDSMQYSFEEDRVEGEGARSVFTSTLVRGIETGEADLNRDGNISIDELYDYLYDQVTDETSKQTPKLWAFEVQGEILVAKNPYFEDDSLTLDEAKQSSSHITNRSRDSIRAGLNVATQNLSLTSVALIVLVVLLALLGYQWAANPNPVKTVVAPTPLVGVVQPTNTIALLSTRAVSTSTSTSIDSKSTLAPVPSSAPAASLTQVSPKDGMVVINIPAGDFLMGSADSDKEANSDEKPQHKVYLDAFWIDKTEVTNAMYALCVRAGACSSLIETRSFARAGYYNSPQYKDYPVIYVSWDDANRYCRWAERRLPTEAEWEKAARGADGRLYPWGDAAPNPSLLNFNKNAGDTTQVGKYLEGASTYGVLDMAGNVWEWVGDWYDEKYYSKSPNRNPEGPASGGFGILRGGAWVTEANYVRAAQRLKVAFDFRDSIVGFRCAR